MAPEHTHARTRDVSNTRSDSRCWRWQQRRRRRRTDLGALLFVGVHDVGVVPRVAVLLLGLALVLLDGALIDDALQVQQVARDGRLAGVDVADEDHVQVLAQVLDQRLGGGLLVLAVVLAVVLAAVVVAIVFVVALILEVHGGGGSGGGGGG